MKIKLFLFASLSTVLSSCCWFANYDCAEPSQEFIIPITINHNDSVIPVNEPLAITINTSAFQSVYDENDYTESSFSLSVNWFDGNFSSQANHKINLLSSNLSGFDLEEYNGYSGTLPPDIELELGFTVPGYYLIQFYGGSSKQGETKRRQCGCGNYLYQNFLFESNINNTQYLALYNNSNPYATSLNELNYQGSYFIKVE